ncbi:MAG TPA: peptidoglycan-binding domain-containing protein [Candidatus Paceibacterota bacterium]|nr:peptidoglycan-binding domain-containing protein [Candidatus Paceibacterota bacterium]
MRKKTKISSLAIIVALTAIFGVNRFALASVTMNIGKDYDYTGRAQIETSLLRSSNKADFYVDNEFYNRLNSNDKTVLNDRLNNLGVEFDNHIYPVLAQTYGYTGRLSQSGQKLNVVIHPLKTGAEGYTRSIDFFDTAHFIDSNNHLTVYLDYNALVKPSTTNLELAAFLAHEFTHIVSLETKDFKYGVSEDTWLAEARSEYSETLLGYPNIDWEHSLLKQRLADFSANNTLDFINWQNSSQNYASVNLFTQYLVEHYGIAVLADTLRTNSLGIDAINIALARNGYSEKFADIYRNWAIANIINDCAADHNKYCYTDDHLGEFVLMPIGYYLPTAGEAYMTANNNLSPWIIHYQKIAGGHDTVEFDFEKPSATGLNKLVYIVVKKDQSREVKTLDLTGTTKASLSLSDFGDANAYLILVLYKEDGVGDYNLTWKASVSVPADQKQAALIASLLKQIDALKQQLAYLLAIKSGSSTVNTPTTVPTNTCGKFNTDLKYGMMNNADVRCLQQFLASQPGIYPLGLITGNYLTYTELAVSDFQDENGISPTGYFGPLTRAAVNGMRGY